MSPTMAWCLQRCAYTRASQFKQTLTSVFVQRTGTVELKTTSEANPKPESTQVTPVDVNILWFMQNLDGRCV